MQTTQNLNTGGFRCFRNDPEIRRLRLGIGARILINLFTLCDGINTLTDRRRFQDVPYAYAAYLNKSGADRFGDKMRVIWAAKQEKTKKIIFAQRRHGRLPQRYVRICKKTPCGVLRLWASYLYRV